MSYHEFVGKITIYQDIQYRIYIYIGMPPVDLFICTAVFIALGLHRLFFVYSKKVEKKPEITFLLLCVSFCLCLCKLHWWQFNGSVFSNGYCKPQNLMLHCLAAGCITHISCYSSCSAFLRLLHHMTHKRLFYILIILTLQLNRTLSSLGESSRMFWCNPFLMQVT